MIVAVLKFEVNCDLKSETKIALRFCNFISLDSKFALDLMKIFILHVTRINTEFR